MTFIILFLILLSPQITNAYVFEDKIEFGIKTISIMADETNLVGESEINHLTYSNQYMNIQIKEDHTVPVLLVANSEYIHIANEDFDYYLPNIIKLTSANYNQIVAENTNLFVYNNKLGLNSKHTEVDSKTFYLDAYMYNLDCALLDNEIDFERCFNNTVITPLSPDQEMEITFSSSGCNLYINANNAEINPKQFKINANDFSFKNNELEFNITNSEIYCDKGHFSTAMGVHKFISGCFRYGHIDKGTTSILFPKLNTEMTTNTHFIKMKDGSFNLNLNSLNIETGQVKINSEQSNLECNISKLIDFSEGIDLQKLIIECANDIKSAFSNININNSNLSLNIDELKYLTEKDDVSKMHAEINGLTGNQNTFYFTIPTLKASCNSIKNFDVGLLINDCLMDGTILLPNINISDQPTNTDVLIKISEASIKNNFFLLKSPLTIITMPTITATINDLTASCKRNSGDDPLNFELLQRSCFENSRLEIPLIEARNNKYNLAIKIKDISINKGQLLLNIPEASYELNDTGIYFYEMNFLCNPKASFDMVKELDSLNTLDNCINDALITIKNIKHLDESGDKKSKFKKIKFSSKDSKFTLGLVKKIMLMQTTVKFEGEISFNKETSEIVLHITKASAGMIRSRKIILYFMRSFFEDENIRREGNTIYIKINSK